MKKALIFSLLLCFGISGCSDSTIEEIVKGVEEEAPFVNVYQDRNLIIYVDKDTKVMYVSKNNGYGGTALTVMVDENGNPKLYEGLD